MAPISDERFEAMLHRLTDVERQQAVSEVTMKAIAEDVSVIKANTSRIVWAVLLAILASVMAFIIRGGLNVPLV